MYIVPTLFTAVEAIRSSKDFGNLIFDSTAPIFFSSVWLILIGDLMEHHGESFTLRRGDWFAGQLKVKNAP